eukprot:COSAG01_NODE_50576_length_362_cov_0.771863_2_plen_35_part_01
MLQCVYLPAARASGPEDASNAPPGGGSACTGARAA